MVPSYALFWEPYGFWHRNQLLQVPQPLRGSVGSPESASSVSIGPGLHSLEPHWSRAGRPHHPLQSRRCFRPIAYLGSLPFCSGWPLPSRASTAALPDIERATALPPVTASGNTSHLVFGAIGIFVMWARSFIGSFLVNYFSQPFIGGLTPQAAAGYVSFYWGGAMVADSSVPRHAQVDAGSVLGTARPAPSFWSPPASPPPVGSHVEHHRSRPLYSVMFPTIFTLGIAELGPLTGKGSALLIMAIVVAR